MQVVWKPRAWSRLPDPACASGSLRASAVSCCSCTRWFGTLEITWPSPARPVQQRSQKQQWPHTLQHCTGQAVESKRRIEKTGWQSCRPQTAFNAKALQKSPSNVGGKAGAKYSSCNSQNSQTARAPAVRSLFKRSGSLLVNGQTVEDATLLSPLGLHCRCGLILLSVFQLMHFYWCADCLSLCSFKHLSALLTSNEQFAGLEHAGLEIPLSTTAYITVHSCLHDPTCMDAHTVHRDASRQGGGQPDICNLDEALGSQGAQYRSDWPGYRRTSGGSVARKRGLFCRHPLGLCRMRSSIQVRRQVVLCPVGHRACASKRRCLARWNLNGLTGLPAMQVSRLAMPRCAET